METEFQVKGTTTFAEYLECHKVLASRRRMWLRGLLIAYGIFTLFYGLAAATDSTLSWILFGSGLIGYALILSPLQFRYRVKQNWNRYPRIQKEFEITLSEAGVVGLDDRGTPSLSSWDQFIKVRESSSLFLLYLSPLLPLVLPKRLVSDQDLGALRALLARKITDHSFGYGSEPSK